MTGPSEEPIPAIPPAVPGRRLSGLAWLSVLPLIVNILSTLASLIIIPGLGEVGWGVWATAVGLSGATSFIIGLGIRPLFIRAMARTEDRRVQNDLIGSQIAMRILLAVGAGTLSLAVGILLRYDLAILQCAALAAAGLVPTVVWTVYGDVLNSQEAFRASAVASLVSGIVLTFATVAVVLAGWGPVGVGGAYLLGPVLTTLQLGRILRRNGYRVTPVWDRAQLGYLFREARLTALGDGIGSLLTQLRGVYVPALIGPVGYGYFAAGTLIITRLQVVCDAIVTAYSPEVSRERDELVNGRPTWSSSTLMRLLCLVGVLSGVAVLGGSGLFIGALYHDAGPGASRSTLLVMMVTSSYLPIAVLGMGWRQLLIAADHHEVAARIAAIDSLLAMLATLGLTLAYGLLGAAIGFTASAGIAALLLGWAVRRRLGAAGGIPGWPRIVVAGLVGGAVATGASLQGFTWTGVVLCLSAPGLTLAVLTASGVLTPSDLRVVGLRFGRGLRLRSSTPSRPETASDWASSEDRDATVA